MILNRFTFSAHLPENQEIKTALEWPGGELEVNETGKN
jgi:hypothetical protein